MVLQYQGVCFGKVQRVEQVNIFNRRATMYKSILIDPNGKRWVYEREIDGHPIFVEEKQATPLLMTDDEATQIANKYRMAEDETLVERA